MVTRKEIHDKSNIYSWGAKVDFTLNNRGVFFDLHNAKISLLWVEDFILTLEPRKIHPTFENVGTVGYRLIMNATDTACEAEKIGSKLAYSLLSVAIEKRWGMSLSWPDSPLPCRVIDRTASIGETQQAFITTITTVGASEFIDALEKSFLEHEEVPYNLLLSKELCASSHIENNDRSKLIMLMSALEALAGQKDYSDELTSLVEELKVVVNTSVISDQDLKNSLIGQIDGLKRESVRRAIQRLLVEKNVNEDDRKFIDKAYQARSKIVHEGRRVPELGPVNTRLEQVLRQVYDAHI